MSSIKITELTEVTQLNSNTAKNLVVTVDLVTGLTNKMTVKNLAANLYSNNSLVVSQSITSNTIVSNTITSNIIVSNTITSNTIVSNTITIIQGVDATQNTRLTVIEGTDSSQNARMTIIEGTNVGQNTAITIIEGVNTSQNVRLDYSNTAITIIQGTDTSQNVRLDYSNTAITIIQGTDTSQNVRLDYSNTAITIIQGVDATQNTNISNKVNLTGSLNQTVSGNLTISSIVSANTVVANTINAGETGLYPMQLGASSYRNYVGGFTRSYLDSNALTLGLQSLPMDSSTANTNGGLLVYGGAGITGNVYTGGVISPGKGLVYLPLVYPGAQTAVTIDFANNSLVRANTSSGVTVSFSNFNVGKTVDLWITNTSGGSVTFTHGCSALNSTNGATTVSIPLTSSIRASYVSFGTDVANTFVAITK